LSVVAESPRKRKASSEPDSPHHSAWYDKLLRGLHALSKFREYLTLPPDKTGLKEYFAVRRAFCPDNQPWDTRTVLGFKPGEATEMLEIGSPSKISDRIAAEMASGKDEGKYGKRQSLADLITNLLAEISSAITSKLRQGELCEFLVSPRDFGGRISNFHASHLGYDETFVVARAADLRDRHPLASFDREWLFQSSWDGHLEPSFVLGPADAAFVGSLPRNFYRTETAKWWTAKLEYGRLVKRRSDATTPDRIYEMYAKGEDPRERIALPQAESIILPGANELLATVQPPAAWSERIKLALDVARHQQEYFKYPQSDTPLQDLVFATQAIGFVDHNKQDVKLAPDRFAAVVAGLTRYSDLREMLLSIVGAVDNRLIKSAADAMEWAMLKQAGEG
jgi:hypothetical protein